MLKLANYRLGLSKVNGLKWLWLTALVVAADIWTKHTVSHYLQIHQSLDILPWFNLTLIHNYGAAFSFLSDAGGWQVFFLSGVKIIISLFILLWLSRLETQQRCLACALALVLGGALGNLWDRLTLGYVVDFIDISISFFPWSIFNPWPAFNIADSAISVGMVLLIIDTISLSITKDKPA